MHIVRHSITFYLRSPKLDTTGLCVIVQWKGTQIRKGCGVVLQPKFWDNDNQRIKPAATGAREVNAHLEYLKTQISNIFKTYAIQNPGQPVPSKEHVNNALQLAMGKTVTDTSTFFGFIEQHVKDRRKDNISASRIKQFDLCIEYLKTFATDTRKKLEFDTLKASTVKEFLNYLYTVKRITPASARLYLNIYVYFLKKAARAGHITNLERILPERAEMPVIGESFKTYLTYTEILQIAKLDFSKKPMYDKVRDLFLIGCATGLRESDYTKVKPEAIQGNELKIFTQKSKKFVRVPVSTTVLDILKKYNGSLPDVSIQHLNHQIKKVCKMAGITEPIEYAKEQPGGMVVAVTKPKYMLVASHTARRSYATNAYKTGVPINVISHVLGHSNIATTEKYLRLTDDEKAAQAQKYGQLMDFETGAQIESRQSMKIAK